MIVEVELVNVKSYSKQTLKFTKGVNAILGDNGAGKTTILEAIGFVLFDTLPYKISDFLRRGEKKGEVRVKVLSPKDERVYEVVRKFSENGTIEYYIHDPESIRVAEGALEVSNWIKEHFGIEISTKTIFENAIGVSQGKIISQFLESASVRDRIFSPILGIESYKKAFEKSREYEKYLEEKIAKIDKELAIKRKEVEQKEKIREKIKGLESEKVKYKNELRDIVAKIDPVNKKISKLDSILNEINNLQIKHREIETKLSGVEEQLRDSLEEVEKLKEIEKDIPVLRRGYETYIKAETEFNALNKELSEIDESLKEIGEKGLYLAKLETEIGNLKRRLEEIKRSEKKLKEILPLAEKEEKIQEELRNVESAEKVLDEIKDQINKLKEEIRVKVEAYKAMLSKVEKIRKLSEKLEKIPKDIEKRRDKAIEAISKLRAELEFQKSNYENVKDCICPILKERCDRLLDVKTDLENKIKNNILKIEKYEKNLKKINSLVDVKKKAEVTLNELKGEIKQIKELKEEIELKKSLLSELADRKRGVEEVVSKKESLILELKKVEGFARKKVALESEIKDKKVVIQELKEKIAEYEAIKETLKSKDVLENKRKEIRSKIKKLGEVKDLNKKHYERYLEVKETVKRKREILNNVEKLRKLKETLIQDKNEIEMKLNSLKDKYDESTHLKLKEEYQKLISKKGELEGRIRMIKASIHELSVELSEISEIERKVLKLDREMKRLEKKYKFIKDLREIFKKAIPEITKAYVNAISIEANRIFCEIMNDYNWEIRWHEDFGIRAKYLGREIDFMQMSGGEQMCAALAIRLALLKVLANVGIAFFDEPTQNMDEQRRRNLAVQLSRVDGFEQIFVISHDDTFEEMVENAIKIKKENGTSLVEL